MPLRAVANAVRSSEGVHGMSKTERALDPVTFEVLKNAFATSVDLMSEQILRTCHSFVIYARDFSSALCDREGNTIMQGSQDIAVHVGTLHFTCKAVIEAFAQENPNFHFYACFSRTPRAQPRPRDRAGHVHVALQEIRPDPAHDIAYLCGNPNMVDQAFTLLKEAGLPVPHIRREKYISSR